GVYCAFRQHDTIRYELNPNHRHITRQLQLNFKRNIRAI
ncbi:MAG: hypothetical protein ACJA1Y_001571, partial [Burkholderiaceae bacterium]